MKVVLFCGGLGLRLRDHSQNTPKPMAMIGHRPIIWHLMSYYAYYGHKDFILCLGYRGDAFKEYFLNYNEALANDFVLSQGGRHVELLASDIGEWRITFVDTGLHANIGQRLRAVRRFLEGEEVFLANYSDGLTDLDLDAYVATALERKRTATFVKVRPSQTFHVVRSADDDLVTDIQHVVHTDVWINGGFFVLTQDVFDSMRPGEELVEEPFRRLRDERQLLALPHEGFFMAMDTFKEREQLEGLWRNEKAPWQVW
jgi:glucose-1-phosphate cytidylyltransferase